MGGVSINRSRGSVEDKERSEFLLFLKKIDYLRD